MKTGLKITALCLALVMALGMLASCSVIADPFADGSYITADQLLSALEKYGNDGDNINVTVEGATGEDLLAASHAILSSVSIITKFSECRDPKTDEIKPDASAGSGVIYRLNKASGDAYILTNYHVVFNEYAVNNGQIADDIKLYLYGQEYSEYGIDATYVGGSMKYDVAVLRVKNSAILRTSSAIEATFADSDLISPLERTIAIGNPNGKGISATTGIVSVVNEYIELSMQSGTVTQYRVIRTDAAVNKGNSGGGLFNAKGEIIGIVHARENSNVADNVGYAIPGNLARAVANNIIANCDGGLNRSVLRCLLGIVTVAHDTKVDYDAETGRVFVNEKARVTEIVAGGKAVGKFKVGDVILSVNIAGEEHIVTRSWTVADAMLDARVGDTVTFKVDRGGREIILSFEITRDYVVLD